MKFTKREQILKSGQKFCHDQIS